MNQSCVCVISFQTTRRKHQLISFDGLVIHTLWHIFSVISLVVFASAYFYKINILLCGTRRAEEFFQQTHPENVKGECECECGGRGKLFGAFFPCSTVVVCHSLERKCSINLTCGNNRLEINIRLSLRTAHIHTHVVFRMCRLL